MNTYPLAFSASAVRAAVRAVDPDATVPSSSRIVRVASPRVCGPLVCSSSFAFITAVLIRFRDVSRPAIAVMAGVRSTPAVNSARGGPGVVDATVESPLAADCPRRKYRPMSGSSPGGTRRALRGLLRVLGELLRAGVPGLLGPLRDQLVLGV